MRKKLNEREKNFDDGVCADTETYALKVTKKQWNLQEMKISALKDVKNMILAFQVNLHFSGKKSTAI